jgi:hypothetical protein
MMAAFEQARFLAVQTGRNVGRPPRERLARRRTA